ncbi:MAG: DNA-deoxyinosine glycosylase [Sulfurospirillaceae bacterium]|nr:DNA-deoxyinosine glycosylase [Sulfurospirillaceae bacterium]
MHTVSHTFSPITTPHSKILILGTFPSVASRAEQFYYAHPQNRFWKVLSTLVCKPLPKSIDEKIAFLHANHIALWDVIQSCTIENSSDASIKEVIANDIETLLHQVPIEHIFANGAKAYQLYMKLSFPQTKRPILALPSTSPANAACSLECLIEKWRIILEK